MNKLNDIISIDLHIHSVFSEYKEKAGYVQDSDIEHIDVLLQKLNENKVNMFSITDHNRFSYKLYLILKNRIAENLFKNVYKNLPGVEFDVQIEESKPSCHIIAIFDDKDEESVKRIEDTINGNLIEKQDGYYTRDEFERILREIGLNVVLIAHQHKHFDNEDGGPKSLSNSVTDIYDFIRTGYINALEYQKPSVQGMLINSLKKANENVATIIGSDCHKWLYYPCKDEKALNRDYITKIKALPNFDGLVFAFTNMENRFNRVVNKNTNIIESIKFDSNELVLSNGINAIIGDNGSGKTFLLEFLSNEEKLKKHYKSLADKNKVTKTINGQPNIYYVEQNQIIDQVKKGELFNNSKYYNAIATKTSFKESIIKYARGIIDYINYNIETEKAKEKLDEVMIKLVVEKENLFIPTVKIDIQTSFNKYKARSEALENIIKSLKDEILSNQDFYKEYEEKINSIKEQLEFIKKSVLDKSGNIELDNQIRNLIISALRDFDSEMDKDRTDKEKENVKYKQEKTDLCNLIIDYINRLANKPDIPKFPEKVVGVSKKLYQGFVFVKKAKYDELFLEDEFYEELFNKSYSKEQVLNITSTEQLEDALQGIKDIKKIDTWYSKVDKFIEDYLGEETYIERDGQKNTIGETPGEISAIHYDFLFNDLSKDYDIIIIDQPEDDISSTKITKELLKYIKQVRDYKQIIIATHNPLLVVNLDVDNVICLNKNYKDEITIKDGCLEYSCQDYKIIDEVADIMDGGKEAVERRFRLYGN